MSESKHPNAAPATGAVSGVGGASPANVSSPTSPGKIYLLSTGYIPIAEHLLEKGKGVKLIQRKITIDEAKELIREGFVSAVGHEATANLLTRLLGTNIPTNRIQVFLEPGDRAISFVLRVRLPEGKILTDEEIANIPFYLMLTEVYAEE
jgi:hypothetical protein